MQKVVVLGATGSIGRNTLDVLSKHPDRFQCEVLTAHSNAVSLFELCQQFKPTYAVLIDEVAAQEFQSLLNQSNLKTELHVGMDAMVQLAADSASDIVVAAIVGSAGLLPTLAAIKAGKRVLLANKESLVMAGALMIDSARQSGAQIIPVDSEHNALMQCLPSHFSVGQALPDNVHSMILTASGGPFRNLPLSELSRVSIEQALKHPRWVMGPKISIDSATMMNKGLEMIEAHWLFDLPIEKLEVLIHPESTIHSFVRYTDGSLLAQLGVPDMRVPISAALAWPERLSSGAKQLDVLELGQLNFEAVDPQRYPSLALAEEAIRVGQSASLILNAANEVAVGAFLKGDIAFTGIAELNDRVMQDMPLSVLSDIDSILAADQKARELANQCVISC